MTAELATITPNAGDLIARAIDSGAGVDTLTSLYELQRRIQEDAARQAYFEDLARFQATVPEITKTKKAGNFMYAPLDSIIKQLNGHFERFGFAYRFNEAFKEDGKEIACIVTHNLGHTETSSVFVPLYVGAGKTNKAQDYGGVSTYGKRLSLCSAFGLVVDSDDDGSSAGPNHILKVITMVKALRSFWEEATVIINFFDNGSASIEEAAQAYAHVTREALTAWNLAPSYGGFLSRDEREFIKSNKEFHDLVTKFRNEMSPPWHERPENQL